MLVTDSYSILKNFPLSKIYTSFFVCIRLNPRLLYCDKQVEIKMAILRSRKITPHAHESGLQALRRKAVSQHAPVKAPCLTFIFQGQHVSPKWDHHGENPPRFKAYGIENPGVLCYRNSLIQSLFHIPKFANWLKFHHPRCPLPLECTACLLRNLLNMYWTGGADQLQSRRNRVAKGLQWCITRRGCM